MSVLDRELKPGYAPGITFVSLAATYKRLGVSFYQYIHDRIEGTNLIPPIANLVTKASKDLNLGCPFMPV